MDVILSNPLICSKILDNLTSEEASVLCYANRRWKKAIWKTIESSARIQRKFNRCSFKSFWMSKFAPEDIIRFNPPFYNILQPVSPTNGAMVLETALVYNGEIVAILFKSLLYESSRFLTDDPLTWKANKIQVPDLKVKDTFATVDWLVLAFYDQGQFNIYSRSCLSYKRVQQSGFESTNCLALSKDKTKIWIVPRGSAFEAVEKCLPYLDIQRGQIGRLGNASVATYENQNEKNQLNTVQILKDDLLIAADHKGNVKAIDLSTGTLEVIWHTRLTGLQPDVQATVNGDGKVVVVGYAQLKSDEKDSYYVFLDCKNGAELWHLSLDESWLFWCPPLVTKQTFMCQSKMGNNFLLIDLNALVQARAKKMEQGWKSVTSSYWTHRMTFMENARFQLAKVSQLIRNMSSSLMPPDKFVALDDEATRFLFFSVDRECNSNIIEFQNPANILEQNK